MVDVTMILERLKLLATYVALLREEQQHSFEQFDNDIRLQFVAEHALQLSIQITWTLQRTFLIQPQMNIRRIMPMRSSSWGKRA